MSAGGLVPVPDGEGVRESISTSCLSKSTTNLPYLLLLYRFITSDPSSGIFDIYIIPLIAYLSSGSNAKICESYPRLYGEFRLSYPQVIHNYVKNETSLLRIQVLPTWVSRFYIPIGGIFLGMFVNG